MWRAPRASVRSSQPLSAPAGPLSAPAGPRCASVTLNASSGVLCAGGSPQSEEEEEAAALLRGSGVCKWFNMRMGFGFISMSSRDGTPLDPNLDVFVHQVRRARVTDSSRLLRWLCQFVLIIFWSYSWCVSTSSADLCWFLGFRFKSFRFRGALFPLPEPQRAQPAALSSRLLCSAI